MNTPTYLDEHPRRQACALSALAPATGRAQRVTGLRIDTDGHLSEVLVPGADPWSAMRAHVAACPDLTAGAAVETLDDDLAMWFDENGAEHARHNPVASVAAAMFGRPGPLHGPVVFTGYTRPRPGRPAAGGIDDVSVAVTLLLAGIAPTCDPHVAAVDRAAEFARLGIDIVPAPRTAREHGPDGTGRDRSASGSVADVAPGDQPEVSYDAQAHTLTTDGDLPRCAECHEHVAGAGHPEHQPEVLAEQDSDLP